MKLKTKLWLIAGCIIAIMVMNAGCGAYQSGVDLHNMHVTYTNDYTKTEEKLISFFDTKFLAYQKKEGITHENRDAFIAVTTIIMTARKDGDKLAWKWLQENQPIPYEEFTSFYRDLSSFVEGQFDGIYAIEREKQDMVATHNKTLQIYPNNLINNWFLKIPPLTYKFGFVSDSTRRLFNLK